jgi:hypothetical protein
MTINDYIRNSRRNKLMQIKRVVCKDGFSMSVQANSYTYCTPRDEVGPYTHVEIGFPSQPLPELEEEYGDNCEVYGYVPVEVVDAIITKHGGLI